MMGYIVILVLFIVYGLTLAGGLITYFIKSVKTSAIRAELEQEYQEKHKRLESEYAEKEAALKKREQKVAFHEERDKSFSSRWQQLIDRERKIEERERELKEKGADYALDRLAELERREKALEAQEKRVEILGAIQDEINKMLGMSDKLQKLADEVEREIGSGSFIESRICDIGFEYNEVYLKVNDLVTRVFLTEQEELRSRRGKG